MSPGNWSCGKMANHSVLGAGNKVLVTFVGTLEEGGEVLGRKIVAQEGFPNKGCFS